MDAYVRQLSMKQNLYKAELKCVFNCLTLVIFKEIMKCN